MWVTCLSAFEVLRAACCRAMTGPVAASWPWLCLGLLLAAAHASSMQSSVPLH